MKSILKYFTNATIYGRRYFFCSTLFCLFLSLSNTPLNAFDTFWHNSAKAEVGRRFGFSADAIKVLQFSSFGADYFGPVFVTLEGTVEKVLNYLAFRNLPTTGKVRMASNYMHFDNLLHTLDRNWKFDYIWKRLLENTRKTIVSYYKDTALKAGDRKMLILLTLGSSLHMIEDFYSHSDWIHFDFSKMGFAEEKSDGYDHAPTWFEVRQKLGVPSSRRKTENWHFRICSGLYPVNDKDTTLSSLGVPLSHTTMNHDNSQLYYDMASQIKYHGFGAHPAQDSASAAEHQLYAFHTACAAGIEWVSLVEEDPDARKAIDLAKGWDAKVAGHAFEDDLNDGESSIIMASCLLHKWDGSNPPAERDKPCGTLKLLAHIHIPKISNMFWGAFPTHHILENMTAGIGDDKGNYTFDSLWTGRTLR